MRRYSVQVRLLAARLLMGYFRLTVIQVLLLEVILSTLSFEEVEWMRCGLGNLQWLFSLFAMAFFGSMGFLSHPS